MVNTRHLKRHRMPASWPVERKGIPFISKPNPGSFQAKYATSVVILLRDVLKLVQTAKEAKQVINAGEIMLNGREVKDLKFPCGLFDVLEIKSTKQKLRIVFDTQGRIDLVPATESTLYLKVTSKTQQGAKSFQINCMNGYNLKVDEKTFKKVKVQDTIVFDYEKKKVIQVFALKEGVWAYVFDGNFKGHTAQVLSFKLYAGRARDTVELKLDKGEEQTAKEYCYIIAESKEEALKVVGGKK